MHIEKLKDTESEYEERLNLKSIRLKNLEELEKTGFTIQDLKKIKMMLIEIAVQHNITNIEHLKAKFFELFEKLEDRISFESKNNLLLKTSLILENQIRINRQTLHCQEKVGPILKNLFEKGITEFEIVALKAFLDILLYYPTGNDIANTNIKYEIFKNLFNNNNNNWRNEYEKVKLAFHLILVLNEVDLSKIQFVKDRFIKSYSSFPSTFSYKNSDSDNKIQEEIADSIIWYEDTIYRNFCSWSFLTNN